MADQPRPKPARITGIAHFFAAAGYSIGGIKRLWAEAAFRHEVLAMGPMAIALAIFGANLAEFLIFGALVALLIATEALNTAIECLVDHISPNWAEFARDAKDLGSLAVMCVLICHGLLLVYVIAT